MHKTSWLIFFLLPVLLRAQQPNVIIILADDLGYNDVGYMGSTEIPTPNIDKIARNGVWFTDGYSSCPVCAPGRAGLLTGRYQNRFGIGQFQSHQTTIFSIKENAYSCIIPRLLQSKRDDF